jgi:hypothetical protein
MQRVVSVLPGGQRKLGPNVEIRMHYFNSTRPVFRW